MSGFYFPENDLLSLSFLALMSAARVAGFLAGFTLVNFAIKRATIIRLAFAFTVGLPVGILHSHQLYIIFSEDPLATRLFLPVKELLLGFLIGKMVSLPFYAFLYAGAVCDMTRGESSNSLSHEGSDTVTTTSLLFYLVFAFNFIMLDGMWKLFQLLYRTYAIWPIEKFLPTLRSDSVTILFGKFEEILLLMIVVCGPLVFIMLIVEVFFGIAGRVSKRFGLDRWSSVAKSLVFLICLPIYSLVIGRLANDEIGGVFSAFEFVRLVFR
jgi:type III secretion protein T